MKKIISITKQITFNFVMAVVILSFRVHFFSNKNAKIKKFFNTFKVKVKILKAWCRFSEAMNIIPINRDSI